MKLLMSVARLQLWFVTELAQKVIFATAPALLIGLSCSRLHYGFKHRITKRLRILFRPIGLLSTFALPARTLKMAPLGHWQICHDNVFACLLVNSMWLTTHAREDFCIFLTQCACALIGGCFSSWPLRFRVISDEDDDDNREVWRVTAASKKYIPVLFSLVCPSCG